MIAVGIDPGLKGAISVVAPGRVEVYDIPTFSRKEQNHAALADLLRRVAGLDVLDGMPVPSVHVGLEKAGTRRGQAAQAVLKTGANYGAIVGIVTALCLPYSEFTPVKWKNVMLAGFSDKKSKTSSEMRACQLYPDMASSFRTARGALLDGRCEALLIARYTFDLMTMVAAA